MQALIDAIAARRLRARIACVVADRPAAALARAERAGVAVYLVERGAYRDSDGRFDPVGHAAAVAARIPADVTLVVLAGYLSVVGAPLLDRFAGRIINVHPALLPRFGGPGMHGRHVHGAVLAAGVHESGCTVHRVDAGIDTGPILVQHRVEVLPDDSIDSLAARIAVVEHRAIVEAVAMELSQMKVLIVGSGAREDALAARLVASPSVEAVVVAPGNAGIARRVGCRCIEAEVTPQLVTELGVQFVVIGPEAPLVDGLADRLRAAGHTVVGPGARAARLEGSKAFAKDFMQRHGVPTAEAVRCTSVDTAAAAVDRLGVPVVIKADGLAAGKGVSVCLDRQTALDAIHAALEQRVFGAAGESVLVEQYLDGFEASVIVLVDESGYRMLPPAQDHKAVFDGGTGPNTGGMGVVAPHPTLTAAEIEHIEAAIVRPSVRGLQEEGWLFRGALFIGLMIGSAGVRVLEYNVRFGDPEAQALLPLMGGDLGLLLHALGTGQLERGVQASGFHVRAGSCCAIVAAAAGYPGEYRSGDPITVAANPERAETQLYWAGVRAAADQLTEPQLTGALLTAGGRVLTVVGQAASLAEARSAAYEALCRVQFPYMHYRNDIGGPPILAQLREESHVLLPDFAKRGGIVPVVVQEIDSGTVLMVGYADRRALDATLSTSAATFYSTSRRRIWVKGEESGNRLAVEEVRVDCDQDALLYRVRLLGGGACHTKNANGGPRHSCFYRAVTADGGLSSIAELDR